MIIFLLGVSFFQNSYALNPSPILNLPESYDVMAMDVSDEHIVLLKRTPPFVAIYNHQGKQIQVWGDRGPGPEELTYVRDVAFHPQGILVLNIVPNRISLFSMAGKFKDAITLDEFLLATSLKFENGRLIVEGSAKWLPESTDLILIRNGEKQNIGKVQAGKIVKLTPPLGPPLSVVHPYADQGHWTLLENGHLVRCESQSTHLRVNEETWSLQTKKYLVLPNAWDLWLKDAIGTMNADESPLVREAAKKTTLPDVFPPVLKLLNDRNKLWVWRAIRKEDQYWECYQNGAMIASLSVPIDLVVRHIRDGKLYSEDPNLGQSPLGIFQYSEH